MQIFNPPKLSSGTSHCLVGACPSKEQLWQAALLILVGSTSLQRRVMVSEGGSCAGGFGLDSAGTLGCLSCQGLALPTSEG